jgi:hypothetical protein
MPYTESTFGHSVGDQYPKDARIEVLTLGKKPIELFIKSEQRHNMFTGGYYESRECYWRRVNQQDTFEEYSPMLDSDSVRRILENKDILITNKLLILSHLRAPWEGSLKSYLGAAACVVEWIASVRKEDIEESLQPVFQKLTEDFIKDLNSSFSKATPDERAQRCTMNKNPGIASILLAISRPYNTSMLQGLREQIGDEYLLHIGITQHELLLCEIEKQMQALMPTERPVYLQKPEALSYEEFETTPEYQTYRRLCDQHGEEEKIIRDLICVAQRTGFFDPDSSFPAWLNQGDISRLIKEYELHYQPLRLKMKGPQPLAPNFSASNQDRYQQFWQEKITWIALSLSSSSPGKNEDSLRLFKPGIKQGLSSQELYRAVAQARMEIARELGQRPMDSHYTYGAFSHERPMRDVVVEPDVRFGTMFKPLAIKLREQGLLGGEFYLDIEGNIHADEPSDVLIIALGKFCKDISNERHWLGGGQMHPALSGEPAVVMMHSDSRCDRAIWNKIDTLVQELLDSSITEQQLFENLGKIMWYLGNMVPLEAGSAAVAENFAYVLLTMKGYEVAANPLDINRETPWYFDVKVTPRDVFAKDFIHNFKEVPQLTQGKEVGGPSSS